MSVQPSQHKLNKKYNEINKSCEKLYNDESTNINSYTKNDNLINYKFPKNLKKNIKNCVVDNKQKFSKDKSNAYNKNSNINSPNIKLNNTDNKRIMLTKKTKIIPEKLSNDVSNNNTINVLDNTDVIVNEEDDYCLHNTNTRYDYYGNIILKNNQNTFNNNTKLNKAIILKKIVIKKKHKVTFKDIVNKGNLEDVIIIKDCIKNDFSLINNIENKDVNINNLNKTNFNNKNLTLISNNHYKITDNTSNKGLAKDKNFSYKRKYNINNDDNCSCTCNIF